MTRKDYVAIAAALRGAIIETGDTPQAIRALNAAANNVSEVMQRDNSRFDRSRFLDAVFGVEGR